jgi:non-ribosomal peptide synthetase component F
VLNHQLTYWREQLKGAPPVLQLPSDRPRQKEQTFQGSHETISFSGETAKALRKLGQQEGVTLFMGLLAGFQTLLSRYSGHEQIVVGTDLANRTTTETERLIGFFINLLALRVDLSGNPTFRELLVRVREVALGAYAHQAMPFDKLVEELQPERSLSHNPLVQVLFVMQNLPRQKREITGLTLEPFELPTTRSKFDLAVFVVDGGDDLTCYWLYSTDLFDRTTIQRIARHFETLLTNAVAQPDARLSALEMLSEEERFEQDAGKQQKKQSQLKKLLTAQPKTVEFPEA